MTHTGFDVQYFIPNSLIASFLRSLWSTFVLWKVWGHCGSGERKFWNFKIWIDFRKSPRFSLTSPLSQLREKSSRPVFTMCDEPWCCICKLVCAILFFLFFFYSEKLVDTFHLCSCCLIVSVFRKSVAYICAKLICLWSFFRWSKKSFSCIYRSLLFSEHFTRWMRFAVDKSP